MLLFICVFSLFVLAGGAGPFTQNYSSALKLAYPNGIQAEALVQNALYLLCPSIPDEFRYSYPEPDEALLKAAKAAQAEKRKVRLG